MTADDRPTAGKPPSLEPPDDLPADPHLTYHPGRSAFLGAYPTSFPTRLDRPGSEDSTVQQLTRGGAPEAHLVTRDQGEDLELLSSLAQGGLGEVWLGCQKSLQRRVAVKRLRHDQLLGSSLEQRRGMRQLFRQEALATARLEHPNIVPVYQLLEDASGNPLLSMKRVKGRAWNDLLKDEMNQPVGDFLARHLPILIDVAQAVAFAHSQGILHRDIKPHQVMVGEFGEVLLMDWGLAMPFGDAEDLAATDEGETSVTSSGSFAGPAGTPSFMAPEQALGDVENLGPWTDLYLLGGVLYFLLTGTAPHKAPTSMAALMLAAKSDVPPPAERVVGRRLPQELVDLAASTLLADPQKRSPQTVQGFIKALQEYLSGASRREQARLLVNEVEAEGLAADYLDFEQQLTRLREASLLWPDHPQVEGLVDQRLAGYIEAALEQKDLTLARVQAEQLGDEERRHDYLQRIAKALEMRHEESRQRRWALVALAAVVVMLVAGGVKYVLDQRLANERLLTERDVARQARAESEDLISFMLEDLWDRLSEIQRVDILSSVSQRTQDYFAGRDVEGLSDPETLNLGQAMSNLAQLLANTGQFAQAIEADRRAVEVFEGIAEGDDLAEVAQWERLHSLLSIAGHLRDLGRVEEGETTFVNTLEEVEGLLQTFPDEVSLWQLRAGGLDGLGVLYYDLGRLEQAKEYFEAARSAWLRLVDLDPGETDEGLLDVEFRIGVTLMDLGRLEEALDLLLRVRTTQASALELHPRRPDLIFQLGFYDGILGNLYRLMGRAAEGKEQMTQLLPSLNQMLADDPQNAEGRYTLTLLEQEMGETELALGNAAAARDHWRRGVELVEEIQPTDHGYLLDTLVRCHLLLGDLASARPIAEELLAKDWDHRDFREFCRRYGLDV